MDCSLPGSSIHGILQARILFKIMENMRHKGWLKTVKRYKTHIYCWIESWARKGKGTLFGQLVELEWGLWLRQQWSSNVEFLDWQSLYWLHRRVSLSRGDIHWNVQRWWDITSAACYQQVKKNNLMILDFFFPFRKRDSEHKSPCASHGANIVKAVTIGETSRQNTAQEFLVLFYNLF